MRRGCWRTTKDQKRAEDRKQQIEATLLRKFSELDKEIAQLESFEETITKWWIEPYKQGEMPKPGNYLDVGGDVKCERFRGTGGRID